MTQLIFGSTIVHVYSTGTLIEYADGTSVPGMPEATAAYRETAQTHGYGDDTLSLCIDHEITHVALEHFLGHASPTMKAVKADSLDTDLLIRQLEEAAVLAVQRYARAVGVDLVKRFSR